VNGIAVRRFPVRHERDPREFARRSDRVFESRHSVQDELDWLDAEGPASTALVGHLARNADHYDFCLFFSYRYYHAYHGARAALSRAVLVPTAEREASIGLSIFPPLFRAVRAVMYNSPEERAMIHAVASNQDVPGVIVGVGSEVPNHPQPNRFRQKYGVRGPFAVYVGRIDRNKGCNELFEFFERYVRDAPGQLTLVLIGDSLLPIPDHPRIRHLGFLDDTDKFDAMAAADLLIMPSYYESLSMVALEAWALGKPVLVNGRCDVLRGQCLRSNAGLYYESCPEFLETLSAIERHRWLAGTLGRNGRQYFRSHYDWPVIERKYLDLLARLAASRSTRPIERLPGWFERRRRTLPAAEAVLASLPTGPVVAAPDAPGRAPVRSEPDRRRA
jgi:glycosyltransferase involved in cell wall biosynthesis